ncbi:hypothetical protein AGMMS49936_07750 [Endomicrobiia bacterium]|nr:hypothetical protein AGMMS49936_07750 [Endomicrobiia bacterium]
MTTVQQNLTKDERSKIVSDKICETLENQQIADDEEDNRKIDELGKSVAELDKKIKQTKDEDLEVKEKLVRLNIKKAEENSEDERLTKETEKINAKAVESKNLLNIILTYTNKQQVEEGVEKIQKAEINERLTSEQQKWQEEALAKEHQKWEEQLSEVERKSEKKLAGKDRQLLWVCKDLNRRDNQKELRDRIIRAEEKSEQTQEKNERLMKENQKLRMELHKRGAASAGGSGARAQEEEGIEELEEKAEKLRRDLIQAKALSTTGERVMEDGLPVRTRDDLEKYNKNIEEISEKLGQVEASIAQKQQSSKDIKQPQTQQLSSEGSDDYMYQ